MEQKDKSACTELNLTQVALNHCLNFTVSGYYHDNWGGKPSLLADKVQNQEKTTKSNSGQDTRERPQEHHDKEEGQTIRTAGSKGGTGGREVRARR